jgi:hypothetical protein
LAPIKECLDHILVINEIHLLRVLREYFAYYHDSRPHRLRSSQPLTQGELDTSGVSIGEDCKTNLSRSPVILQSGVCPRVSQAASSGDVLRRPA